MSVRKSAARLETHEVDRFMEAIFALKTKKNNQQISVYDQFVSLHGAVMGVLTPNSAGIPVNFAHWNIGFLPWHRQYLRSFESVLSNEAGERVSIPYWDWTDNIGAANKLFNPGFLSSLRWGSPQDVSDGLLRYSIPNSDRPSWWPAGLSGFRIDGYLEEMMGTALERGSVEPDWPPSKSSLDTLVNLNLSVDDRHPLWVFWAIIEEGHSQLPQTHNAGHRFIGGHMGGAFSPNDPVFWLHHANVDRLWADWQQRRIDNELSANALETYPMATEDSPIDGNLAPEGHKVGDVMWPWIGDLSGYESVTVSQAVVNRLPSFTETVYVEDVLDSSGIGVRYQTP